MKALNQDLKNMTTKHQENIDKVIAWSLLDPKPICLYVKEYDETLVAWNGMLMTKVVALNMAIEQFGKYPTPKMKQEMFKTYKQLYMTGFFGEQNWDSFFDGTSADNLFSYLRKINQAHLVKTVKDKKITEILGWFRT